MALVKRVTSLDTTLECLYDQENVVLELQRKTREAKAEMQYLKLEAIKEIIEAGEIDLLTINMAEIRRRRRR